MGYVTDGYTREHLHGSAFCAGQACSFHNPSNHHMMNWPLTVRLDRFCMTERICAHGVGHPDPDSLAWLKWMGLYESAGGSVHGCDGCCKPPTIEGKT